MYKYPNPYIFLYSVEVLVLVVLQVVAATPSQIEIMHDEYESLCVTGTIVFKGRLTIVWVATSFQQLSDQPMHRHDTD